MEYSWSAPKYAEGQFVRFDWGGNNWKTGRICSLETSYDHNGVAFHTYRIQPLGGVACRWATEDRMCPRPGDPA